MKKFILMIVVFFICSLMTYAQNSTTSDSTIVQNEQSVSWGKEIGYAIDGALGSIEEHVVSISETSLGHTAIFLVVWKVISKDMVGIIVGIFLLILFVYFTKNLSKLFTTKDFSEVGEAGQVILFFFFIIISMTVFGAALKALPY